MTKGIGRPTDYDPKYCDDIVEFMSDGKSLTAFAAHIGCCRQTLHNWGKANAEFLDATKRATALAESYWETQLAECARGKVIDMHYYGENGCHVQKHNVVALIFLMKARFKQYRDQMDEFEADEPYDEPDSMSLEGMPEDEETDFAPA